MKKAATTTGAKEAMKYADRADKGAPIDDWFGKQPEPQRSIALELRALVAATVPDAVPSLKWGMPNFALGGVMMAAISAHKAHVNMIFGGPPDAFDDPDGLLEGTGSTGKHLKLKTVDGLPKKQIVGWLKTAARIAKEKK